jgi:hypothetical protein
VNLAQPVVVSREDRTTAAYTTVAQRHSAVLMYVKPAFNGGARLMLA